MSQTATIKGWSFARAPVDSAVMRTQNSALLVQLIWAERQISRIEISRRTGLSPSTVSLIVNALSKAGLVREIGTVTSARGRRPTLLAFCDDFLHIVGVEIGVCHVAVALTDLRGQVLAFRSELNEMRAGPDRTLSITRDLILECLKESRVPRRRVMGIGVAVPSPLNRGAPGLLSQVLYPTWAGIDVRRKLETSLCLPVLIENDANLGALAEHWWGVGVNFEDVTYIKIGAGLGSGHIVGGELYRGTLGTAGEIGHVSFDPDGEPCVCGGRGCLTTLIGSDALVTRAGRLFGGGRADVAEIIREARRGNESALALLHEIARHLGQVIVGSIVNLLCPALIVLGGEVTAASELLLDPLRKFVSERSWTASFDTKCIVFSRLGPQAIAVGAATLYLDDALRHPERFFAVAAATGS